MVDIAVFTADKKSDLTIWLAFVVCKHEIPVGTEACSRCHPEIGSCVYLNKLLLPASLEPAKKTWSKTQTTPPLKISKTCYLFSPRE